MKPFVFLAIVVILLGATACAQGQEEWPVRHPEFSFFPHRGFPFPKHGAMPPMPAAKADEIKCFKAVHNRAMATCLKDVHTFFETHKVSVSHDCCSALENIQNSCKYESPFLKNLISQHCSGGAPAPSS